MESTVLRVNSQLAHLGMPIFMPTAAAETHKPEDVVMQWEPFCQTTFATYVDNVFITARDAKSLLSHATAFEEELTTSWNQSIKPSSREFFVPRGVAYGHMNL